MPIVKDDFYLYQAGMFLTPSHLMKGSSDHLRHAIGTVISLRDDADEHDMARKRLSRSRLDAPVTTLYEDLRGIEVLRAECDSDEISYIETNILNMGIVNSSIATPNVRIPFRLYANPDKVYGDVHWREIFTGGSWAGQNYKNLIDTNTVYYDSCFNIETPVNYKALRAREMRDGGILGGKKFDIVSKYLDYNHLAQSYQDWATGLSSELLIPNYDIVSSYYYRSETAKVLESEEVDEVMEKQISFSKEKSDVFKYHFPYCKETEEGTEYYDSLKKDQYFGSYFVNTGDNAEYREAAMTHQKNIMYDQHYFDFLEEKSVHGYESLVAGIDSDDEPHDIDNKLSTFYNISFEFERQTENAADTDIYMSSTEEFSFASISQHAKGRNGYATDYLLTKIIDQYNFSSKFLELLKDIDEGTITDVHRRKMNYHYWMVNRNDDITWKYDYLSQNEYIQLNSTNFLHFLLYAYNNYDVALNDNYIFMGPDRPEHVATSATDSLYRNMNSQNLLGVIDATYDTLNAYFRHFKKLLVDRHQKEQYIFEKILSPQVKFREVLAYKIEKFASTPTGDYSTQEPIQKFWIYNSYNAPNKIRLTDSQVKYNKNYTYKITAYTLVMSHKYKYQDFRLTKQIGTGKLFPDHDSTIQYCLQFYNPENNQISPQLLTPKVDPDIYAAMKSALATNNVYASSEVEVSEHPQVADFHLYLEPCLELVEVPIYQKTLKVLENPPNAINVVPFHFIDDSNRVGFKIGQDSFIQRTYPEIISPEDATLKEEYLNTKEYISKTKISSPSESPARYIEMYRIRKKPNAFSDFKDGLVATMDLRIPDDVYNYADHIATDKIVPNRKYYYIFRLLNENRMPGPLSQIIECELINDGGYVYSLFDTVDSSEFNPSKITTDSISFKKIMQVEPNINQMYFDTSNCDFGDYATNQIDNLKVGIADELIWDKKFKIRLTSKKTGKKLDLNISFNKREKDLSKLRDILAPPDEVCEPGVPTHQSLDVPPETVETSEAQSFDPASADCTGCRDTDDPTPSDPPESPPISDIEEEPPPDEDFIEEDDGGSGEEEDSPPEQPVEQEDDPVDDPQPGVNDPEPEPDDTESDEDTGFHHGGDTGYPQDLSATHAHFQRGSTTDYSFNYKLGRGHVAHADIGVGMPLSLMRGIYEWFRPAVYGWANTNRELLFDLSTGQWRGAMAVMATAKFIYALLYQFRGIQTTYLPSLSDGSYAYGPTMLNADLSHAMMCLLYQEMGRIAPASFSASGTNLHTSIGDTAGNPGSGLAYIAEVFRYWIESDELWFTDEQMQGPGEYVPDDYDLDKIYSNMNLAVPNCELVGTMSITYLVQWVGESVGESTPGVEFDADAFFSAYYDARVYHPPDLTSANLESDIGYYLYGMAGGLVPSGYAPGDAKDWSSTMGGLRDPFVPGSGIGDYFPD